MQEDNYNSAKRLFNDLILPFYSVERDMPMPVKDRRNENDAEHSWSLALMACALAPMIEPRLDVGKICQLAIVHDLVELHAGDVSVFSSDSSKHQAKQENESAALEKIKKDFSEFAWLTSILDEYERQDSDEAKFVRAVDKLTPPLMRAKDNGQYFKDTNVTLEKFKQFIVTPVKKAEASPRVAEFVRMAHQELANNPELFAKE